VRLISDSRQDVDLPELQRYRTREIKKEMNPLIFSLNYQRFARWQTDSAKRETKDRNGQRGERDETRAIVHERADARR